MSLSDKVKKRKLQTATIEVDGIKFRVFEKSLLERGKIQEKISKKKNRQSGYAEAVWLEYAAIDADDGSSMTAQEWLDSGTTLTGKVFSVVAKLNHMGDDDVEFEYDPKEEGTTAT